MLLEGVWVLDFGSKTWQPSSPPKAFREWVSDQGINISKNMAGIISSQQKKAKGKRSKSIIPSIIKLI